MDISVISATFNRAQLLDNALQTYNKQKALGITWEYIIVDDMSTDNTKAVVEKWQKKLPNLKYMTSEELGLPKEPGVWRDGCTLRNRASTFAKGKLIVLTHPEIMLPPDALKSVWETANNTKVARPWFTAIPYWMPEGTLPKGWKTELSIVRNMKGFYDPSWPDNATAPGGVDYRNNNQEIRDSWESEVFSAFWVRDWRWFGGFREFTQWGSVDIDQMNRRRAAGFKTVFIKSNTSPHKNKVLMVYHQNHGSVRDMEKAMQGVRGLRYDNEQAAREAGGLFSIYYHGPRERSHNGSLDGVLGDHVARYKFAAAYANDKHVLDIPCGTGYGCRVLFENCPGIGTYQGVEIDGESVEFARNNYYYSHGRVAFLEGDMLDIPIPDDSIDLLVCFEGIEHIEDKEKFVSEMYRVLRKDGTFIISTPNPANTPGTAWDRFMLQPADLILLFHGEQWVALDWYHQSSYSIDEVAVKPGFNSKAQIMILGGSVVK